MIAPLFRQVLLSLSVAIALQADAVLKRDFIFETAPFPSCHASTLAESSGGLVAAWFGGTRERDPDVGIWLSRQIDGQWTAPVEVANGIQPGGNPARLPTWNPVLFQPKSGPLMLFYKIGPSPETWWGMLMTSSDGGTTWSPPRRLPDGIPGPIKNKPIELANGDILSPSSEETPGKPERWTLHFERSSDHGLTWSRVAPPASPIQAIQPSLLLTGGENLLAIGRTRQNRIFETASTDNGRSWSEPRLGTLPNPNSGTDAITLTDGRHLIVYNHVPGDPGAWGGKRTPLNLAVSKDGHDWQAALILENTPGEYSYPAVIQTRDGLVHVTYTWQRKKIAHAVIDPAKLRPWEMQDGNWDPPPPPGTVIHHSPASSGLYIGSPSLCVLPDGSYLASHDYFGPKSNQSIRARGRIYQSTDKGKTWSHLTDLDGFFWQNLFVHQGKVFAMGTDHEHGKLIIRRSDDGGKTWTEPTDAAHGLISEGQWHTAPMPVIEHQGRLWRAFEDAEGGTKWGERYRAHMLSTPIDADLLNSVSWTISNPLARDPSWLGNDFAAWLEGNAVLDPAGNIVDILRVDNSRVPEKAAIVRITPDGKTATFDPANDFIDFPGGAKKFTIRKDPEGGGYWSLANIIPEKHAGAGRPGGVRNTLALVHSEDLRVWETRCILLQHPDPVNHGFQYVDWLFDGKDLIATCRTAWDDGEGGAHNNHDANYLTFHRWKNFRDLTRKDDVSETTVR